MVEVNVPVLSYLYYTVVYTEVTCTVVYVNLVLDQTYTVV